MELDVDCLSRDDLAEDADIVVDDCVMSSKMTPVKMKRSMCRCGGVMGVIDGEQAGDQDGSATM